MRQCAHVKQKKTKKELAPQPTHKTLPLLAMNQQRHRQVAVLDRLL